MRGVKKTTEQFAIELAAVHDDKITLAAGAEYITALKPIKVDCAVCGYQWSPLASSLVNNCSGCPECAHQRKRDTWGKKKASPKATEAEKEKARQMNSEGMSYEDIASELKRSPTSVRLWCNPEAAEKKRQDDAAYRSKNIEQVRAKDRRYRTETSSGKAGQANAAALRRYYRECDWVTLNDVEQQRVINFYHCRNILNEEAGYIKWHVDHIYPLVLGGAHEAYNLRLLKAEDNLSKGKKLRPEDWNLYQQRVAELFQPY